MINRAGADMRRRHGHRDQAERHDYPARQQIAVAPSLAFDEPAEQRCEDRADQRRPGHDDGESQPPRPFEPFRHDAGIDWRGGQRADDDLQHRNGEEGANAAWLHCKGDIGAWPCQYAHRRHRPHPEAISQPPGDRLRDQHQKSHAAQQRELRPWPAELGDQLGREQAHRIGRQADAKTKSHGRGEQRSPMRPKFAPIGRSHPRLL